MAINIQIKTPIIRPVGHDSLSKYQNKNSIKGKGIIVVIKLTKKSCKTRVFLLKVFLKKRK